MSRRSPSGAEEAPPSDDEMEEEDDRKPAAVETDEEADSSDDDDDSSSDEESDSDSEEENNGNGDDEEEGGLSAYEKLRLERIKRNQERLKALGLQGQNGEGVLGGKKKKTSQNNKKNTRRSSAPLPRRSSLSRSTKKEITYTDAPPSIRQLLAGSGVSARLPKQKSESNRSGRKPHGQRMDRVIYDEFRRLKSARRELLKQAKRHVRAAERHERYWSKQVARLNRRKFPSNSNASVSHLHKQHERERAIMGCTAIALLKELDKRQGELREIVDAHDKKEQSKWRAVQQLEQNKQQERKSQMLTSLDRFPRAIRDAFRSLNRLLLERVPRDPPPPRRSKRTSEEADEQPKDGNDASTTIVATSTVKPKKKRAKKSMSDTVPGGGSKWRQIAAQATQPALQVAEEYDDDDENDEVDLDTKPPAARGRSRSRSKKPPPTSTAASKRSASSKGRGRGTSKFKSKDKEQVEVQEEPKQKKKKKDVPRYVGGWVSPRLALELDRSWLERQNGPKSSFQLDNYVPQIGDTVLYYPAAHYEFLQAHPDPIFAKTKNILRTPLWNRAKREQKRLHKGKEETATSNWWTADWINDIDGDAGRYPILCRVDRTHAEFPKDPYKKDKVIETDPTTGETHVIWKDNPSSGNAAAGNQNLKPNRKNSPMMHLAVTLRPLTPVVPPKVGNDGALIEDETLQPPPNLTVSMAPYSDSNLQPFLIPFAWGYALSHSFGIGASVQLPTKEKNKGEIVEFDMVGEGDYGSFRLHDKSQLCRQIIETLQQNHHDKSPTEAIQALLQPEFAATKKTPLLSVSDACLVIDLLSEFVVEEQESPSENGAAAEIPTTSSTPPNLLTLIRSTLPILGSLVISDSYGRKKHDLSHWDIINLNEGHKKLRNGSSTVFSASGGFKSKPKPPPKQYDNPFDALVPQARDFLESIEMTNPEDFVNSVTSEIAELYGPWRAQQGLPVLKGSGNGATISAWKTTVRKATRGYQDPVLEAKEVPQPKATSKNDKDSKTQVDKLLHVPGLDQGLFPSMDESLRAKLELGLKGFIKHNADAQVFLPPITDDVAEGYSCAVPIPMCFDFVFKRLKSTSQGSCYYRSIDALLGDIQAVCVDNCILYNSPDSDIVKTGLALVPLIKKILADICSRHARALSSQSKVDDERRQLALRVADSGAGDVDLLEELTTKSSLQKAPDATEFFAPFAAPIFNGWIQRTSPDETWGGTNEKDDVIPSGWTPQAGDFVSYSRALHAEFVVGHLDALTQEQSFLPPTLLSSSSDATESDDSDWIQGTIERVRAAFPRRPTEGSSDPSFPTASPILAIDILPNDAEDSITVHWRPCLFQHDNLDDDNAMNEAGQCAQCSIPLHSSFLKPAYVDSKEPPRGISQDNCSDLCKCFAMLKRRALDNIPSDFVDPKVEAIKKGEPAPKVPMDLKSLPSYRSDLEVKHPNNGKRRASTTSTRGKKRQPPRDASIDALAEIHLLPPWLPEAKQASKTQKSKTNYPGDQDQRTPFPNLSLEFIELRLRNGYYRQLAALLDDISEAYVSTVLYSLSGLATRKTNPVSARKIAKYLASTRGNNGKVSYLRNQKKKSLEELTTAVEDGDPQAGGSVFSLSEEELQCVTKIDKIRRLYATAVASVTDSTHVMRAFGISDDFEDELAETENGQLMELSDDEESAADDDLTLQKKANLRVMKNILAGTFGERRTNKFKHNGYLKVKFSVAGKVVKTTKAIPDNVPPHLLSLEAASEKTSDGVWLDWRAFAPNDALTRSLYGRPNMSNICARCHARGRSLYECRVQRSHSNPDFDLVECFSMIEGIDALLAPFQGKTMPTKKASPRKSRQDTASEALAENEQAAEEEADVPDVDPKPFLEKSEHALQKAKEMLGLAKRLVNGPVSLTQEFIESYFVIDPVDNHYIFCTTCGLSGDIMCCEGKGCPNVAHPQCAGLTEAPDTDWLCPKCQPEKDKSASKEAEAAPVAFVPRLTGISTEGKDFTLKVIAMGKEVRFVPEELLPEEELAKLAPPKYDEVEERDGQVATLLEELDEVLPEEEKEKYQASATAVADGVKDPQVEVGTTIFKTFDEHGTFSGKVMQQPSRDNPFYLIEYEDGDTEQMHQDELLKLIEEYNTRPTRRSARKKRGRSESPERKRKKKRRSKSRGRSEKPGMRSAIRLDTLLKPEVNPVSRRPGARQSKPPDRLNYKDDAEYESFTDESDYDSDDEPVTKSSSRDRFKLLSKHVRDFLKVLDITSVDELLESRTSDIATDYIAYREANGFTEMKGKGAARTVSLWKTTCRGEPSYHRGSTTPTKKSSKSRGRSASMSSKSRRKTITDPLDAIPSSFHGFLEYAGIQNGEDFVERYTGDLANLLVKWRKKQRLPELKGSGPSATISAWKTKVRAILGEGKHKRKSSASKKRGRSPGPKRYEVESDDEESDEEDVVKKPAPSRADRAKRRSSQPILEEPPTKRGRSSSKRPSSPAKKASSRSSPKAKDPPIQKKDTPSRPSRAERAASRGRAAAAASPSPKKGGARGRSGASTRSSSRRR